jgi:hypothetical protein
MWSTAVVFMSTLEPIKCASFFLGVNRPPTPYFKAVKLTNYVFNN